MWMESFSRNLKLTNDRSNCTAQNLCCAFSDMGNMGGGGNMMGNMGGGGGMGGGIGGGMGMGKHQTNIRRNQ